MSKSELMKQGLDYCPSEVTKSCQRYSYRPFYTRGSTQPDEWKCFDGAKHFGTIYLVQSEVRGYYSAYLETTGKRISLMSTQWQDARDKLVAAYHEYNATMKRVVK